MATNITNKIDIFFRLCFCLFCGIWNSGYAQTISKLDTIANTGVDPYNCICYQEIERSQFLKGKTTFRSTGFLIKPNVILTAGHNVYSNGFSNVTNIRLFPGRYKETYASPPIEIPSKKLCSKAIRVHPSYRFSKRNRINYDFAIIVIPQTIIDTARDWIKTACFGIDKDYELKKGDQINVAGYPASHGYNGSLMTCQAQDCEDIYNRTFSHDFDTQTGNSGSPIWVNVNGKRIAVGVHTFAGAGTKLTKEDIDMISDWIAELSK